MSVNIGTVPCIVKGYTANETAAKVLEEAAEVFAAWQECQKWCDNHSLTEPLDVGEYPLNDLVSESADVVQAVCNLLNMYGVHDMCEAMGACRKRNEERGREYEDLANSEEIDQILGSRKELRYGYIKEVWR